MATPPRYVPSEIKKWTDEDINAVVARERLIIGSGLDWDAIAAYLGGLTASGIIAAPYDFIIRYDGVDYSATSGTGVLTYGGPDDAGGVDGADCTAVAKAVAPLINGTLYFKKGEYTIDDYVRFSSGANIEITGEKGAVIKVDDAFAGLSGSSGYTVFEIYCTATGLTEKVHIHDLTFNPNLANQIHSVNLITCTAGVNDVEINGNSLIDDTDTVTENVGFIKLVGTAEGFKVKNARIHDNLFYLPEYHGYTGFAYLDYAEDVNIYGNHVWGYDTFARIAEASRNINIYGNTIHGNAAMDIVGGTTSNLKVQNVNIIGNTWKGINDAPWAALGGGLICVWDFPTTGFTSDVVIANNILEGDTGFPRENAIVIYEQNLANAIDHISIVGNKIDGANISFGGACPIQVWYVTGAETHHTSVKGNTIKNTAGTYSLNLNGLSNGIISENDVDKIFALTSTTAKIHHNVGFITENSGTGSIVSGTTSDVIAHGCNYTPTAQDIVITLTENPTNTPGAIWISAIGASEFTVNCENDPGASNLDFSWAVRKV